MSYDEKCVEYISCHIIYHVILMKNVLNIYHVIFMKNDVEYISCHINEKCVAIYIMSYQ